MPASVCSESKRLTYAAGLILVACSLSSCIFNSAPSGSEIGESDSAETDPDTAVPPSDAGDDTSGPPTDADRDTSGPPTDADRDTTSPPADTDSGDTRSPVDTGDDADAGDVGTASCRQIYRCVSLCDEGENDTECVEECEQKGTRAATDKYEKLNSCANRACPNQSPTCILDNCKEEHEECGLTGEADCRQTAICRRACSQSESPEECRIDCVLNASFSDQEDLYELFECTADNCRGKMDPLEPALCQLDKCGMALDQCGMTGSDSCGTVLDCTKSCTSVKCRTECIADGDTEAQKSYYELVQCRQLNECERGGCSACNDKLQTCRN